MRRSELLRKVIQEKYGDVLEAAREVECTLPLFVGAWDRGE